MRGGRNRADPLLLTERRRPGMLSGMRASFLTGLIVILPFALTLWLVWSVIGWIDGFVLPLVPHELRPEQYIGINLRGVGVIILLVFILVVGWVARGVIGRAVIRQGEGLVDRMPIVRTIYSGAKQIAETVFAQGDTSFDRACLIEYPRRGIWALGFISTEARGEVAGSGLADEPLLSVFLPTTPNPTSGFLLFLPESDVVVLEMSIEDAAKLVISAGLVYPNGQDALPDDHADGARPHPGKIPPRGRVSA